MSGRSKNWLIVGLAVFGTLGVGLAASGSEYLTPQDYAVILTTLVENSAAISAFGPLPAASGERGVAVLDRALALDSVDAGAKGLISTLRTLGAGGALSADGDDDTCPGPPSWWPKPWPWPWDIFENKVTLPEVEKELVAQQRLFVKIGDVDAWRGITTALAVESAVSTGGEGVLAFESSLSPTLGSDTWAFILEYFRGLLAGPPGVIYFLGEGWFPLNLDLIEWTWTLPLKPAPGQLGGIALDPTAQWLYYVDSANGTLNRADAKDPGSGFCQVVANGLKSPGDVALDLTHGVAYVTESTSFPTVIGQVWITRINLTDASAFPITLDADSGSGFHRIKMGMGGLGQIALDATGESIYAVQWPSWIFCRFCLWGTDCEPWCPLPDLVKLDLAAETKSVVTELRKPSPGGIALTNDGAYAYVAGAHGALWRVDLATSRVTEVQIAASSVPVAGAGHFAWTDASQTALYMAGNSNATLWKANLSTTPATLTLVRDLSPDASLEGVALDVDQQRYIFVSTHQSIRYWSLEPSAPSGGYAFKGVGRVPVTSMLDGYANTTDLPGTPQFRDAAFGGTLDIFMTPGVQKSLHNPKLPMYYRIMAQHESEPRVPLTSLFGGTWYDVTWDPDPFQRRYVSTPRIPIPMTLGGKTVYVYPLLSPAEVDDQYRPNLIMSWPTSTNGTWHLTLEVFSEASGVLTPVTIASATNGLLLEIDNTPPVLRICSAVQGLTAMCGSCVSPAECVDEDTPGVTGCDTVTGGDNLFRFCVTAVDREGHLLSWGLEDIWGNNCGRAIAEDSYDKHVSADDLWYGIENNAVPAVAVELDGTCCAHAVHLTVFGRTCNGWTYIQRADYYMTFTLALTCP